MTKKLNNDIVNEMKAVIEVAFFMSISPDVSGAEEGGRKERTPKEKSA